MAQPTIAVLSDRELKRSSLNVKLIYIFFYAAIGFYVTFFMVYLERKGLSGTQIGWLNSIPPLVALFGNPFWSTLADRFRMHRQISSFMAFVAGGVTLFFLITNQFWVMMLLVILLYFHREPLISFIDSAAMDLSAKSGMEFGRLRVWGSIGFIAASYGLGQLLTNTPIEIMFWLQAGFLSLGVAGLALTMPIRKQIKPNIWKGITFLLSQRQTAMFLLSNVLFGIGISSVLFMGLHILEIGGTNAQVGLFFAAKAILEVPMMLLGGKFYKKHGNRLLVTIGLLGQAIILGGMALANTPIQLILIISTMGIAFAIYRIPVVSFANEIAPEGMETTTQALANACAFGFGNGFGSILYGIIWDLADGHAILWTATIATLLSTLVFWLGARESGNR